MNTTNVGTSSRTPFKHWLFNAHLGQMIGATSTGKTPTNRAVKVFDLCAGDGLDTYGECSSSPSIIRKHMTSEIRKGYLESRVSHLYEREAAAFNSLLEKHGDCPQMNLHHQDSREIDLSGLVSDRDSSFVYADPNNIDQLPITQKMVNDLTPLTLYLMTLGCNVAGLKRLSVEARLRWFQMIEMLTETVRGHHDVQLIWLNRDSSQWAYLACVPKKWSDATMQKSLIAGQKMWKDGVQGLTIKRDGMAAFKAIIRQLFLTKEENQKQ